MLKTVSIIIDSRNRDMTKYPNANSYVVEFDQPIKLISSVTLVCAIYAPSSIPTSCYVNLVIPELANYIVSNNNLMKTAFTQLPIMQPPGQPNLYTNASMFVSRVKFPDTLAKLGRMMIQFWDSDQIGLFDVGEHYLRFEVDCHQQGPQILPAVPKAMQGTVDPRVILSLGSKFTREELIQAFRRKMKDHRQNMASNEVLQNTTTAFKNLLLSSVQKQ